MASNTPKLRWEMLCSFKSRPALIGVWITPTATHNLIDLNGRIRRSQIPLLVRGESAFARTLQLCVIRYGSMTSGRIALFTVGVLFLFLPSVRAKDATSRIDSAFQRFWAA